MTTQIKSNSPKPESINIATPPIAPLAYNVRETALALGISKPSVYRLLARNILYAVPHLRHKRIARSQIVKLVEGGHSRG
jgi:hypothetical protein